MKTDTEPQNQNTNYSQQVAASLLEIGAVGFKPENPITFKSGIISPVYVDNRKFPYFPKHWSKVISGFEQLIQEKNLEFDVIAGIETAGIPHSAALGYKLQEPSVFVRKKIKDHGTKSRVEGGSVENKKILLIEDLVTTGSSSLAGVSALRSESAIVTDCLAIITYDFPEAKENFHAENVTLHTLTTFTLVLETAIKENILTVEQKEIVADWFSDPHGWATRHGHA
jgi:orotate phosphoribosyltransferase